MKNKIKTLFLSLIAILIILPAKAEPESFDVYKIDLSKLEKYDVVKKGTSFDSVLDRSVFTKNDKNSTKINFKVPAYEDKNLNASGIISRSSSGKRFAQKSELELSINMLHLEDGREVNISAVSPDFSSLHPPHASSNALSLARTITSLSVAASPATLGASLGVSFLVNGLLSAKQNGPSDFIWGGLSGSGFSIAERILRKQPDVHLPTGTTVPFVLQEDLKISKGIQKEKFEEVTVSEEEAITKIKKLIQWGDLTGALEYSVKTGQKEAYDELIKKISS